MSLLVSSRKSEAEKSAKPSIKADLEKLLTFARDKDQVESIVELRQSEDISVAKLGVRNAECLRHPDGLAVVLLDGGGGAPGFPGGKSSESRWPGPFSGTLRS